MYCRRWKNTSTICGISAATDLDLSGMEEQEFFMDNLAGLLAVVQQRYDLLQEIYLNQNLYLIEVESGTRFAIDP